MKGGEKKCKTQHFFSAKMLLKASENGDVFLFFQKIKRMTEHISQELLAEYAEAFSMYDVHDTNTIPVEKLELVLNTLGVAVNAASLLMMQQRKLNEGEKEVSFEEFLYLMQTGNTESAMEEQHLEDRSSALRSALGLFDVSSTGVISVVDLRRALRDALKDTEIEDLVKQSDPNGTGKINVEYLAELIVGM